MSDYFNLVNQYNNQAQEKVEHVAGLMNIADESLSATLENKKNELLGKWETGAASLAGISGAWSAGRKVYNKLGSSKPNADPVKPSEESEAKPPVEEDEPQIEELDAPEEFGQVMPDILTAQGTAPMSANAAAFGGGTSSSNAEASSGLGAEEGGAAAEGAEGAATIGAESGAGAASTASEVAAGAAQGSTAALSTGVSTTSDVVSSSLSSAGNMGSSVGSTVANVATPETSIALTSGATDRSRIVIVC